MRALSIVLLALPAVALADAPTRLPVQGVLADADGVPLEAPIAVEFTLYADDAGATEVFSEVQTIDPTAGHFVAYLGDTEPLDWAIARDNAALYLGITVDTDDEMDLIPIATTPYAGWADYAGNAESLDGLDLAGVVAEVGFEYAEGLQPRYTDEEAVAAMGPLDTLNPLNHPRYTDDEARGAMGNRSNDNPLNHDRYTDEEARNAMGPVNNDNVYAHERYTDQEARDAMGPESNTNPYNHQRYTAAESVAAVAAADPYLRNTGDTLDGGLTVTGAYRDASSPRAVRFIKMSLSMNPETGLLSFAGPDGTTHTAAIDGTARVDTSHIVFVPGTAGGADGRVYLNIDESPGGACTLLHEEDDVARPGMYYGADGGNGKVAIWGNDFTRTFEISREGVPGNPIASYAQFAVMCF